MSNRFIIYFIYYVLLIGLAGFAIGYWEGVGSIKKPHPEERRMSKMGGSQVLMIYEGRNAIADTIFLKPDEYLVLAKTDTSYTIVRSDTIK